VGAIAFKADRWTRVVAGVFLIPVGVAVFMAKPKTVETITSIRRRIGRLRVHPSGRWVVPKMLAVFQLQPLMVQE
jgi:hypothetical protein